MRLSLPFGSGRSLPGLLCLALGLWLAAGCARRGDAPSEFPPVQVGMTFAAAHDRLAAGPGRIVESTPRMLRLVGRDRRVAEEVFLFFDGKLAAWTLRFARPATPESFRREARRLTAFYGKPAELEDRGLVLMARWRARQPGSRVLLSGYVGGRADNAPLMVRFEDASVLGSLIRQMVRDERAADSAAKAP